MYTVFNLRNKRFSGARRGLAVRGWLALGLLSATGIHAAPPNVVLVTLDTTRADRMGFLGSKLGLTPNLDELAKRSIIFTRAYAVVPLTTASHATILTGTYPEFNGVNDFGKPLPTEVPYLPELLQQRGYKTAAFVGSLVLDPIGGTAPGFDRGFDKYDAGFRMRKRNEDRFQTVERRGGEVVAAALKWLRKRPRGPFFLWVHLYDAHDPYDPPEPYAHALLQVALRRGNRVYGRLHGEADCGIAAGGGF